MLTYPIGIPFYGCMIVKGLFQASSCIIPIPGQGFPKLILAAVVKVVYLSFAADFANAKNKNSMH